MAHMRQLHQPAKAHKAVYCAWRQLRAGQGHRHALLMAGWGAGGKRRRVGRGGVVASMMDAVGASQRMQVGGPLHAHRVRLSCPASAFHANSFSFVEFNSCSSFQLPMSVLLSVAFAMFRRSNASQYERSGVCPVRAVKTSQSNSNNA